MLIRLSNRQREVLKLIAEGNSTKKIALILKISIKTVETHRRMLMDRLDIHDVAGLVRYALRAGLIRLETRPGIASCFSDYVH
ncbi:MAG TPA: LuxR C-terminal-related transcriptional regulator [Pyrinomonadaceae bacterium]|nr:LuxR C-terminal-related transcriptional regulator [Pyrinomonadaceae bacterium]